VISRDVVFNEKDGQPKKKNPNSITQVWLMWNETEAENGGEAVEISSSEGSEAEVEPANHIRMEGGSYFTQQLRNRASIRPPKKYELNYVQYNIPETFQEAVTEHKSGEWKREWNSGEWSHQGRVGSS